MVQLELDPRHMPNDRSKEEIEFYSSQILRVGGGGRRKEENKFHPILLSQALSKLLERSDIYFKQLSDDKGDDLDYWVGKALSKALPFLQGVKGNFSSLHNFKLVMFDREILFHLAVDRHRRIMSEQGRSQGVDVFPTKELRKNRLMVFQPTLYSREIRQTLADAPPNELLMEDLKDPGRVIRRDIFSTWDPDYFSTLTGYRQKALILWLQNPSISSNKIAQVLSDEGLGAFPSSTVRVWVKRALDREASLARKLT